MTLKMYMLVQASLGLQLLFGISIVPAVSKHMDYANPYEQLVNPDPDQAERLRNFFFAEISPQNIHSNLKQLSRQFHLTGTAENRLLFEEIRERYKNLGFEDVKTSNYDVFLGYPNFSKANTIHVRRGGSDRWTEVSGGMAKPLGPAEALTQESDPRARHWYVGYSPSGDITGPLVYANYGKPTDWDYLKRMNVSLQGVIVLLRIGTDPFAAFEPLNGIEGIAAAVAYFDPSVERYAVPSAFPDNSTFPYNTNFPRDDILRTEGVNYNFKQFEYGDMLTEFYPSKPYVFRTNSEESLREKSYIPSIPVLMVSQNDGRKIFDAMDGPLAPESFTGKLPKTKYRLHTQANDFRLRVFSEMDTRRRIQDVCAYLWGREEPDQLVILSNHYDAWTFGGFDPNSGTATMLEVARVTMATARQLGWRPRRSLVFCNWDAEEYGLIGSNEWMEEHLKLLEGRAVALLNVDIAVQGNVTLHVDGVPLLYDAIVKATQRVANPNPEELAAGRATVYDSWLHHYPGSAGSDLPLISQPQDLSDHYVFTAYAGVPTTFFGYYPNPEAFPGAAMPEKNGLYHTMYSVEWSMTNLVDRHYQTNAAVAKVWMELARDVSDSLIIPYDVTYYPTIIAVYRDKMLKFLNLLNMTEEIPEFDRTLDNLSDAINRFAISTNRFQEVVDAITNQSVAANLRTVMALNRRLLQLERAFIIPDGVTPEKQADRHVLFEVRDAEPEQVFTFPGVVDSAIGYRAATAADDSNLARQCMSQLRICLTQIQFAVENAILILA